MPRTAKDDAALLRDLLEAAWAVLHHAKGLDEAAFLASRLHQDVIIRVIGIIGEAAWRISADFEAAHPGVPWQAMAGMRHRIVHECTDVDLDLVWRAVTHEIPPLIARLEPLARPGDTA